MIRPNKIHVRFGFRSIFHDSKRILTIVLLLSGNVSESRAAESYWRTDATPSLSWTGTNWNIGSASQTGGTAWTSGDNAIFTENSTLTFATTAIGNVSVSSGRTVTITTAGTLTLGGIRTFDIGANATLTWVSQGQSTAAANEGAGIIKNGSGILSWGAGPSTNARYNGGFTLNAGTVIVSGGNALTSGALVLNGGTLQSSGSLTFSSSSVTIGGDFAFAGSGNDTWQQLIGIGSATRVITNNTTSTATRTFSNTISGSGGLVFSGAGGSGGIVLRGANSYEGTTTVTAGKLELAGTTGSLTNDLGTTGSSGLVVSGGTLLMSGSASNKLHDNATFSLGGATHTKLEMSGSISEATGALTLAPGAGTRIIDFGGGSGVLTFSSMASEASALPLQIWNWSAGTDRLIATNGFGSNIALTDVTFYTGSNGLGSLGSAMWASGTAGDLVPVPEVGALFGALGLLAPLAYRERRHWMRCREARA